MNTWNVTNCLWFTIVSKRKHFFSYFRFHSTIIPFVSLDSLLWLPSFEMSHSVCLFANTLTNITFVLSEKCASREYLCLFLLYAWLIATAKRTIIVINFKALRWNKVTFLINTIIFITQKKILSFHIAVNNVFKFPCVNEINYELDSCLWNENFFDISKDPYILS